jgi:hypothetical protein
MSRYDSYRLSRAEILLSPDYLIVPNWLASLLIEAELNNKIFRNAVTLCAFARDFCSRLRV